MGRRPKQNDPWEGYEFIDISPREEGERSRQAASRRGRASPPSQPRASRSRGGSSQRRPSRSRPVSRGAPPGRESAGRRNPSQNRPRKPMSKGARRFLLLFTLVCMVAITGFLCVFLLFKVYTIEVTGDMVYDQAIILEVAGYQEGDNLALLSTGKQEKDLEEQLPYVQEATISRHFPSTLEIHITAAQKAACISSGGQWYTVSYRGKILEQSESPQEGVMQVTGLILTDPVVGEMVQVQGASASQPEESSSESQEEGQEQGQLQDDAHQTAFSTILAKLEEWGAAGEFTSLDLTDLYNITMIYQGRVEFQLGSTVGLESKLQSGYALVTEQLDENDTGTLNLTLVAEVGKAYFTPTNQAPSATTSSASGDTDDGDAGDGTGESDPTSSSSEDGDDTSSAGEDTSGEDGTDEESSQDEDSSSQDEGRGGNIPDTIFTG